MDSETPLTLPSAQRMHTVADGTSEEYVGCLRSVAVACGLAAMRAINDALPVATFSEGSARRVDLLPSGLPGMQSD